MLEDFVDKICLFWEDTNYIYEESIERKHPSLEARLVIRRAERAKGFDTVVSPLPSLLLRVNDVSVLVKVSICVCDLLCYSRLT